MAKPKKKLDHIVRFGLGVMVTSFALIFGGMFITRPDRSITPYSIGSQEQTIVAVHVPSWTSDGEIEKLIRRFRKVGRETRDFGPMKIQPTTPGDSESLYRRITIYIFSDHSWTEPPVLSAYLEGKDPELQEGFRKAVRGSYRLDEVGEEGRIGPILGKADSAATAAFSRVLFKGPVDRTARMPADSDA
jgi:hypothetical protein